MPLAGTLARDQKIKDEKIGAEVGGTLWRLWREAAAGVS